MDDSKPWILVWFIQSHKHTRYYAQVSYSAICDSAIKWAASLQVEWLSYEFSRKYSCYIIRQSISPRFYWHNISWIAEIMSFLNTKCIHSTATTFLLGRNGLNFWYRFTPRSAYFLNNPSSDLLTEECSGMWRYDDGWIRTFRRKVFPSSRGNAPWRMFMWLVEGQWARIVQRSRFNTELHIFTKLIRKAILERFSRGLFTKCQFASKFGGTTSVYMANTCLSASKNLFIPMLPMRGWVTFLMCI